MRTLFLSFVLAARAADPALEAAPPTVAGPVLADFAGTWFVTSTIDGNEVVDWGCTQAPDSVDFGDGFVVLTVGGATNGGAIKGETPKGDALVVNTTLATCTSTKDITLRWVDSAKKIAEITRCAGSPRTVRAVRNDSAGVELARQCCDANGKVAQRVGANAPCAAGLTAQKPTPLRP